MTPTIQEAFDACRKRDMPISMAFNNGQFVTYVVAGSGPSMIVRAIVRTRHQDGDVTVEAQHELRDGKIYGCYMGYRYRMRATQLTPEA